MYKLNITEITEQIRLALIFKGYVFELTNVDFRTLQIYNIIEHVQNLSTEYPNYGNVLMFDLRKENKMKVTILLGSVRSNSNTEIVVDQFIKEINKQSIETQKIIIKDLKIEHCNACWTCQDVFERPGCPKNDDMDKIYSSIQNADCIIFASPIYSWYCTPPMKAVMDRLVYGMNKYYGKTEGPCLWEGKLLGLITTCGYDIEEGAGIYEEGLKLYSKHSRLEYIGKLAIQDIEGKDHFKSVDTYKKICKYTNQVVEKLQSIS